VNCGKVYTIDPGARLAAESAAAWWIFKQFAAALESRPPPARRRARLRARVLARLRESGSGVTRTVRAADGEWLALAPGVSIKLLRRDAATDNMTAFVRLRPGATLESHVHHQTEECLILEGEILIGTHRLSAGDMHVAAAGTVHAAIKSPRGALLIVRAQSCQEHLS
jgi:quercetin dioxygenase-like cupin family protein